MGWRSSTSPFFAVLLSEWADPGQLAAAALVARIGSPWLVWCGAVAAMSAKAAVGVALGRTIGPRLPFRALRLASAGAMLALAVVCLVWPK